MTSSNGAFQQAMSAAGPSVVHPTTDNPFRIPGSSPLTPPTAPTPMDDVGFRHGSAEQNSGILNVLGTYLDSLDE